MEIMELEKILNNVFINFDGKYAIYANDFNGNILKLTLLKNITLQVA